MSSIVTPHPGADDPLTRATLAKVTRRLLPFLFLLYIVCFLDRVNIGFAALQMNQELGVSPRLYGLGAGIFFLGYVPDRAYYFTVNRTIDLGILAWSPVNFCPEGNQSLPCPAPVGAVVPWAGPRPSWDGSWTATVLRPVAGTVSVRMTGAPCSR